MSQSKNFIVFRFYRDGHFGTATFTFHQEVVLPLFNNIRDTHPEVKTFIDMGGDDKYKMIFFNPNRQPDIRMNGSGAEEPVLLSIRCRHCWNSDGVMNNTRKKAEIILSYCLSMWRFFHKQICTKFGCQ
jgi:hypothetical protein